MVQGGAAGGLDATIVGCYYSSRNAILPAYVVVGYKGGNTMPPFDFSKVRIRQEPARPIDPIEIFHECAVADKNINDLWLAQGDALREWHSCRDNADIGVVLNTGAGKTLVGLLIAQSLVNETGQQVIYACSSIQLVEQTAEKARGYGLEVSTYHGGEFYNGDAYRRGRAPCITTYQALFNGKSRFANENIAAVVFDDAHTAEHILRDQFSLNISRDQMNDAYMGIVALFQKYHNLSGKASSYADLINGGGNSLFLVHPSEVNGNKAEIRRILLDANLSSCTNTMFAWEHIKDHEDLCCMLISRSEVTLTPLAVPLGSLSYFGSGIRRVYLSATLNAQSAFVKAFGRKPNKIIAPSTTAGECERMILIPSLAGGVSDDVSAATDIIENHKALILVPSYPRGGVWGEIGFLPIRSEVPVAINRFRDSEGQDKLILASRYDGIDLPGDTCRVLVIDDLPIGTGPLEKFQWQMLGMQSNLNSTLASRIVQSFGRISRGMSDHGVVLLTCQELVNWISLPRSRSLLPQFLVKQIVIGEGVSEGALNVDELSSAAKSCLSRDAGWITFYADSMRMEDTYPLSSADPDETVTAALAEAEYGEYLWKRDYKSAIRSLNDDTLNTVFNGSERTGAWLTLWSGFAFELAGEQNEAAQRYRKAHVLHNNIPAFAPSSTPSGGNAYPTQILNVSEQMRDVRASDIAPPATIARDLSYLTGDGTHRQVEEAVRCLGQYLGLESTRPDNEHGKGPDVLWCDGNDVALCMELKTDKLTAPYSKAHVGQLMNHIQWVKDNFDVAQIIPAFVGNLNPASNNASPSADMVVIELSSFYALGQRLDSTLQDASRDALRLNIMAKLLDIFRDRNLLWPKVIDSLNATKLRDI